MVSVGSSGYQGLNVNKNENKTKQQSRSGRKEEQKATVLVVKKVSKIASNLKKTQVIRTLSVSVLSITFSIIFPGFSIQSSAHIEYGCVLKAIASGEFFDVGFSPTC